MALQRFYPDLDSIPEALREHYVQRDDGRWILDVDGGIAEDPGAILRARDHEREQRRVVQEELEALKASIGNLDPTKAREALSKVEELEQEKLRSEKDWEALYERKYQNQFADLQRQLEAKDTAIGSERERAQALRQKFASVSIHDQLRAIALELGADPAKLQFLVNEASKLWDLDDNDVPMPYELSTTGERQVRYDGTTGQPVTMKQQVTDMLKEHAWLALDSTGSNARQTAGQIQGDQIVLTREQAKNIQTYEAAKTEAERRGVALAVE